MVDHLLFFNIGTECQLAIKEWTSSAPKQENVADFESTLFVDKTPKGTSNWNNFPKKKNLQKWLDIFDARFPKEVYFIY